MLDDPCLRNDHGNLMIMMISLHMLDQLFTGLTPLDGNEDD
jgi:hypothetical protein